MVNKVAVKIRAGFGKRAVLFGQEKVCR